MKRVLKEIGVFIIILALRLIFAVLDRIEGIDIQFSPKTERDKEDVLQDRRK